MIEVSSRRKSAKEFLQWGKDGDGVEFVFDSEKEIFAFGKRMDGNKNKFLRPHQNLVDVIGLDINI